MPTACAEYAAAGIRRQETMWYYQKQPIAMIYDDNGSIYMDEEAADGIYLHIIRGSRSSISEVTIVTKQQCRELADRHMNAIEPESAENTLMSYVDPSDGKTYYSFDGSKTFEPMTDAEFEARFPTPDVEWWTYDEYKAWLDNEKVQLQSLLGEAGRAGIGWFGFCHSRSEKDFAYSLALRCGSSILLVSGLRPCIRLPPAARRAAAFCGKARLPGCFRLPCCRFAMPVWTASTRDLSDAGGGC